jgi:hypothetical protein
MAQNPRISLRFTDPSGRVLLAEGFIKAWPTNSQQDGYYEAVAIV